MTAYAGPRIVTRPTTARRSEGATLSALRGSLRSLRAAFQASTHAPGPDYADALLLGRS